MGDLPSPPPPFRWTRVWLSCNRSTAPQWVTPRGVRLRFGPIAGPHPRAPLDASGGCLVTGDQRLRSPEEVRLRFGPPQRRRTPMRVKMGAGQILGRKISLGSGDPCHQPGSTHPGGGKANYFKPASGGSGFIGSSGVVPPCA